MRVIGGISKGSVISPKVAELGVNWVPVAVVKLVGLTAGVGVGPGVPLDAGSTEICPVRATFSMLPDNPYRSCGA